MTSHVVTSKAARGGRPVHSTNKQKYRIHFLHSLSLSPLSLSLSIHKLQLSVNSTIYWMKVCKYEAIISFTHTHTHTHSHSNAYRGHVDTQAHWAYPFWGLTGWVFRDALLHTTVVMCGYLRFCHLPVSSDQPVVHKNPSSGSKPPCLAPTILPQSKSLKSYFSQFWHLVWKKQLTLLAMSACFYAFICCQMIGQLIICTSKLVYNTIHNIFLYVQECRVFLL